MLLQPQGGAVSINQSVRLKAFESCLTIYSARYLTSLERRLHKLENLFAELLPGINIEEALAASTTVLTKPRATLNATRSVNTQGTSSQEEDRTFSEALPDESDGFDWKEEATTIDDLADGMAALSVEPTGTGYLGLFHVQAEM